MEALLQLSQTLETFNKSQLSKPDYDLMKQFGFAKSKKSVAAAKAYVTGLIKRNGAINTTPAGKKKQQQDDNKDEIIIEDEELKAHLAELLVDPNLDELDEPPLIPSPQIIIGPTPQTIIEPTLLDETPYNITIPQAEPTAIEPQTTQPIT
jgi:hypothetical protein